MGLCPMVMIHGRAALFSGLLASYSRCERDRGAFIWESVRHRRIYNGNTENGNTLKDNSGKREQV